MEAIGQIITFECSVASWRSPWASCKIRNIASSHAPGMPGTFPGMHHVPSCMPGSLTSDFLRSRWRGKRSRHSRRMLNLQFYVSGKRPMANWRSQGPVSVEQYIIRVPCTQFRYCPVLMWIEINQLYSCSWGFSGTITPVAANQAWRIQVYGSHKRTKKS